ncbi:hypothetical protein EBS40_02235 [bacterium]|nr:hypothetical protein [bacterium]
MEKNSINLYLSRILSGFYIFIHNDKKYKLKYPDMDIKYSAEIYSEQFYEDNKFMDWLTDDSIVEALVDSGIWHYDGDDQLSKIEKQIDDYKVDLYENFLNPPKQKQTRRTLDSLKKSHAKLYNIRHSLDSLTAQGYASLIKHQYILIHSIFNLKDQRIFKSLKNIDYQKLNLLSNTIGENTIDITTFKKIARSDLWRNYWSANKDRIFDKPVISWTDEQRTLVVLTKMYDSAYEHPECPVDSVFEDDDMFDGWMIHQRRENEKLRSKNRTEKILEDKKLDKANEVFIMASSKDEAKSIYDLNDNTAMNIIKERNQAILGKTEVQLSELPDIQRELQIQQNQQMFDRKS